MPLQHEVIDLRSKIIPNLFKNNNEMVSNLNQNQINKIDPSSEKGKMKIANSVTRLGEILPLWPDA